MGNATAKSWRDCAWVAPDRPEFLEKKDGEKGDSPHFLGTNGTFFITKGMGCIPFAPSG